MSLAGRLLIPETESFRSCNLFVTEVLINILPINYEPMKSNLSIACPHYHYYYYY